MSSTAPTPKPKRPFWRRPIVLGIAGALALGGIIDAFDGPDESSSASESSESSRNAEDIAAERQERHDANRAARESRAAEREEEKRREREATPTTTAPKPPAPATTAAPPPPPPPSPRPQTSTDAEIADAVYIGTLDLGDIYYSSEANATTAGKAICSELDRGLSFYEVGIAMMTHGNYGADDAGYIVGAAITAYCPRHSDQLG